MNPSSVPFYPVNNRRDDYKSAGVLPLFRINGEICTYMVNEPSWKLTHKNVLNDAGGKIDSVDRGSAVNTAIREFFEETTITLRIDDIYPNYYFDLLSIHARKPTHKTFFGIIPTNMIINNEVAEQRRKQITQRYQRRFDELHVNNYMYFDERYSTNYEIEKTYQKIRGMNEVRELVMVKLGDIRREFNNSANNSKISSPKEENIAVKDVRGRKYFLGCRVILMFRTPIFWQTFDKFVRRHGKLIKEYSIESP